ncbi:spondin domain-containing protein [bacterium]|nr:spondin domain-containing protein [bacterium]
MKINKVLVVPVIVASMTFACGGGKVSGYDPDDTANYLLTFTSTWSSKTHPQDFPSNPHFSGLIGVIHNENISFWKEGQLATPGIKQMAETGSKTLLTGEIDPVIVEGNAFVKLSGEGIAVSPGTVTLRFTARRDFHYMTLVSMLAPSPDWFVGVSGMSLFENDDWIIEKTVDIYAYDAGTDNGATYTAEDMPANPPEKIKKITGYPFAVDGKLSPIGKFTLLRL